MLASIADYINSTKKRSFNDQLMLIEVQTKK